MNELHRALFFGKVVRESYYIRNGRNYHSSYYCDHYYHKPQIEKSADLIKWLQFYACDFEKPPLEINEKVYINELDITVKVLDRVRSTNGEYVYYVDHIVEYINDEESKCNLEEAKKELERELERYFAIEGIKKEDTVKKKWYQF